MISSAHKEAWNISEKDICSVFHYVPPSFPRQKNSEDFRRKMLYYKRKRSVPPLPCSIIWIWRMRRELWMRLLPADGFNRRGYEKQKLLAVSQLRVGSQRWSAVTDHGCSGWMRNVIISTSQIQGLAGRTDITSNTGILMDAGRGCSFICWAEMNRDIP